MSKDSRLRRTRSFAGCRTCRRRHVKCDGVRPACLTCQAVGATCEGFTASIRWLSSEGNWLENDVHNEEGKVNARRPLYSEERRERMANDLSSSLPTSSVDGALQNIDARSKDLENLKSGDIVVGPFSVLKSETPSTASRECVSESTTRDFPVLESSSNHCDFRHHLSMPEGTQPGALSLLNDYSLATMDSFAISGDSLQWSDLFGLSFENALEPVVGAFGDLQDQMMNQYPSTPEQQLTWPGDVVSSPESGEPRTSGENMASVQPPLPQPTLPTNVVMSQAQILLKYFKIHVIPVLSSLPMTTKSLWEILNFNEAVSTYANLTYIDISVTQARSANLYAILAISAYHKLKAKDDGSLFDSAVVDWQNVVDTATSIAKRCLYQSLTEESWGRQKAKYKDQLMATLALMTFSVISGKQVEARMNLIDAERLVRSRGLAKRFVSRKARFLHHMYTWFRILAESTYVLHDYKAISEEDLVDIGQMPRHGDPGASPGEQQSISRPSDKLDDFLRFRYHEADGQVESDGPKENDVALRDIHLEDSRDNPNTMYAEIFGISETWLCLLSQTTRLANRLDAIRTVGGLNMSVSRSLQQTSERLEGMICSFASTFSRKTDCASRDLHGHLHKALNSALVVLFYRRIRNVNPWVLQSHVDDTIKALELCSEEIEETGRHGWSSVWPAFIAGSEASTMETRERFQRWIERGETATKLKCYETTKILLNELWDRSNAQKDGLGRLDRGAQSPVTWVDLCREKKLWLMACR